jgi:hypothetical protein
MMRYTCIALSLVMVAVPLCVHAQDGGQAPLTRAPRLRPLETVLQTLTRNSGSTVIAESSLAGAQAAYPSEPATSQNLESLLDTVAKSLPPGTIWKKVLLPASTRFYKGDDVADFLDAQTKMLGRTPATNELASVEILGQKLTTEKAAPVVSTLGLKPVYVLINPASRRNRASGDPLAGASGQSDFSQVLNNFATMDPAARTKLMQQFGQMMQNMSPDQRRQLFGGLVAPGRGGGGKSPSKSR